LVLTRIPVSEGGNGDYLFADDVECSMNSETGEFGNGFG